MKYTQNLATILTLAILAIACKKPMDEIRETDYPRAFSPIGLTWVQGAFSTGNLIWRTVDEAYVYEIEISQDSLLFENIFEAWETEQTRFSLSLAYDTRYSVRVRSKAFNQGQDHSKWDAITFRTPAEQLFLPLAQSDIKSWMVTARWRQDDDVSRIDVTSPGLTRQIIQLTPEDIAAGERIIVGLNPATPYTIAIFNAAGNQRRGQLSFSTNPGVNCNDPNVLCLDLEDDLRAAMENPDNIGKTIALPEGYETTITGSIAAAGTMHIFGNADGEKPQITFTGTSQFLILPANADSIVFENLEIVASPGASNLNYFINQGGSGSEYATKLGTLRFENCVLSNFGNNILRFQGSGGQHITHFVMNNCVVSSCGYGATYSFINIGNNVPDGKIEHIVITNSTFYEMSNSFILVEGTGGGYQVCNTILIDNCTFDKILTGGNSRYLINGPNSNIAVQVRNSVFGSTLSPEARGIRVSIGNLPGNIVSTNNHRTTEWVTTLDATNIPPQWIDISATNYGSGRTSLFMDPDEGDFRFRDSEFEGRGTAGDPRWR